MDDKTTEGVGGRGERDAKTGRFLPGHKKRGGGKAGRGLKSLMMARDAAERVLPMLIEQAEAGDMDAVKLLLSYGMPKVKPVMIAEPVPETPADILAAMSAGEVATDIAGEALGAHLAAARIKELDELAARVDALAVAVERLTGGKA